jgi:hypothetical protein
VARLAAGAVCSHVSAAVLHGLPVWQVPLGRVHVTRAPNGSGSRPGQQSGDAVFAEKLREDRLRDQGLSVVRWTWADLAHFTPVADRLRRRLDR